jgi:N4-gp56 family major capsid protein
MAEFSLASGSEKQLWSKKYLSEYVRESQFKPYMGSAESSVIMTKYELQEESGKTINFPLITKLTGKGVLGNGVLSGNEEQLGNYNMALSVDWVRNGVKVPKSQSYRTEIDIFGAAKTFLKYWSAEDLRNRIINYYGGPVVAGASIPAVDVIDALGNIHVTGATAANYNTWCAANQDRILFGAATANYNATHATGLGNVDSTNDKLTAATASLAKRMAKAASPAIRPFRIEDGREFYVMFCGARSFRDLKNDSTMIAANRDARAREGGGMNSNPLFQDGDLIYDGIIFRQVEEISTILTVGSSIFSAAGAASIAVEPNFLCGQQSFAIAWGQAPTPRSDMKDDYEFRPGVAIEELRGTAKTHFATGTSSASKQHGVVTVYTSGVGD